MHPELLKKTYRLKEELSSIALFLDGDLSREEVVRKWNGYSPKPVYRFLAAEDGSYNKKHYLGFYLYSVAGYSVAFRQDTTTVEEVVGEINISVIKKTEVVEQYFRMLMFLSELKALLKLALREKPEVLVIDGTLSSRFITIFPKTNWFSGEEFEGKLAEVAGEFIQTVKENLFDGDIVSFSPQIKEKVAQRLTERLGSRGRRLDILEATLSKIAYFEYLLLLHQLFYGLDWNPLVVGVAKTSHSTEIFNRSLPDIRIFHKFIDGEGYSDPIYINLDELKWEFSERFEFMEEDITYLPAEGNITEILLRQIRQGQDSFPY